MQRVCPPPAPPTLVAELLPDLDEVAATDDADGDFLREEGRGGGERVSDRGNVGRRQHDVSPGEEGTHFGTRRECTGYKHADGSQKHHGGGESRSVGGEEQTGNRRGQRTFRRSAMNACMTSSACCGKGTRMGGWEEGQGLGFGVWGLGFRV